MALHADFPCIFVAIFVAVFVGSEMDDGLQSRTPCVVREKGAEYGMTGGRSDRDRDKDRDKDYKEGVLVHHESLDVYRVGIGAAVAFYSSEAVSRLSNSVYRRLDELLTSMVLNIAEGNGRFSDADQVRFLDTSHESAVKLASRLDLCVTQHLLPPGEAGEWKTLLERVSIMTRAMIAGIQRWGGRQRSRQRLRQREEEGDSEWITQCEGKLLDEPD